MNKGFAVRTGGLLPSVTYHHEPIFVDVSGESRSISITLSYEAHTINIRYRQNPNQFPQTIRLIDANYSPRVMREF